ncbi:MAG TPA: hypothetical protein VGR54_02025 [Nitrosopumilaceae archaeon]|nr:hypothetical protein [Nitrosopumilaceae archaeon]
MSSKVGRWRRPNIYSTIVGIYLIVFSGLALTVVGYLTTVSGLAFFMFAALFFILLCVATLSVGGANRLIRKKEKSFSISLISLIIWSFFLCLRAFGYLWAPATFPGSLPNEASLVFLGVNGIMFFFLIRVKQIQWKSKFDHSQ